MLKIKIRVKEKEDIRLTIEGSSIRETLELDSFVALIGATMKLYSEFAGVDRKVARGVLMLALNDAINDHFAEMNGGM